MYWLLIHHLAANVKIKLRFIDWDNFWRQWVTFWDNFDTF